MNRWAIISSRAKESIAHFLEQLDWKMLPAALDDDHGSNWQNVAVEITLLPNRDEIQPKLMFYHIIPKSCS